jgi:integrase
MVLLAGSTGLRRSEMIALTWADLDSRTMEVNVLRSCVRNRFGNTKTESSCRPVPLHPIVLNALLEWRAGSSDATEVDFLFPSVRLRGNKPLSPDSILEKSIRPALARAGIVGKQIGWHSFRHSLATNLRTLGVDIKVAQELMRHASIRTTLDIYTRVISQQEREASEKVVEMMLPLEIKKIQDPSGPSTELKAVG